MLSDDIFLNYKIDDQKLTAHAKNALSLSIQLARNYKSTEISSLHLLFAIYLETGSIGSNMLKSFGITEKHFKKKLEIQNISRQKKVAPKVSPILKDILVKAYAIAKNFAYPYVGTEHLVYAILENPEKSIKDLLSGTSWKKNRLANQMSNDPVIIDLAKLVDFPSFILGKKDSQQETSYLNKYCVDLNKKVATQADTIIGRNSELERIINILGRKNKNNPLLIGHPGIGKTAIVSQLAHLINTESVPSFLLEKKIMNLDIASLVAGTNFRGEFESRLKNIFNEIAENKNIILFIDEIHNIIGTGNISGSLDLANILKPGLSEGKIQIIGATTEVEHKKYFEKDFALNRRFQPVQITEPNVEETKKIILGIKKHYEKFHNVLISEKTVNLIVELSDRYIKDRFFPDKAIDVLDEASANIRAKSKPSLIFKKIRVLEKKLADLSQQKEQLLRQADFEKALEQKSQENTLKNELEKMQKQKEITPASLLEDADIFEIVARISGIPKHKLTQEKNSKIEKVNDILSAEIIGQNQAIEKISNVLIRAQFGLANFNRPLGSFLFLGPSGTGKTLTAKILAREFFESTINKSSALIRFDMSEFMERHTVSGLIGSPAGYVGFGEGGRLTEKVRHHPHSVVLFDEIEKAHPDVFNLLLQILEDGILTDASGLEVNFKNTIIVLTSNIDISEFMPSRKLGFKTNSLSEKNNGTEIEEDLLMKKLSERIKPELLNRLDHLAVFNSLKKEDLEKIAHLELEKLKKQLEKQNLEINFSQNIAIFIAQKSSDEKFGARLIRKTIQKTIEEKIARAIMQNDLKNNRLTISLKNNELVLK
jgi:ATP-dependent Clp protease ATP-binding subunit ClpC